MPEWFLADGSISAECNLLLLKRKDTWLKSHRLSLPFLLSLGSQEGKRFVITENREVGPVKIEQAQKLSLLTCVGTCGLSEFSIRQVASTHEFCAVLTSSKEETKTEEPQIVYQHEVFFTCFARNSDKPDLLPESLRKAVLNCF